jgi:GcrA cell cycle regulator
MEWTEETIARLRELWDEGHSTAEIGRRMGISKNAVVGKAHRLNLEGRPSPIRREGDAEPQPVSVRRRVTGPTLPPLTAALPATLPLAAAPDSAPAPVPAPPPVPRPAAVAARAEMAKPQLVVPVPVRPVRTHSCCWPLGDPGTRSFRFCDAGATQGKPYCAEHAAIAYVKVRDRREEAAA